MLESFPEKKPEVPNVHHGWFCGDTRKLLASAITPETKLIVEVGSWLGLSTRWLLDKAPAAKIICIDHWKGSAEHQRSYEHLLPILYESFIVACWEYRDRIQVARADSADALPKLAHLTPDLVFIDGSHEYDAVLKDVNTCMSQWPNTTIVGDDYTWESVREAVLEATWTAEKWEVVTNEKAWKIMPTP